MKAFARRRGQSQVAHHIGRAGQMGVALRGLNAKAAFLTRAQPVLLHQASHAGFAAAQSAPSQTSHQTRAAVTMVSGLENLLEMSGDERVLLSPWPLLFVAMRVERALRYAKSQTRLSHRDGRRWRWFN